MPDPDNPFHRGVLSLIPIGISSCLLGERVRYDGGHKYKHFIVETLGEVFEFRSFCPEMAIGMGTPRPAIQLVKIDNRIEAIGVDDACIKVTDDLTNIAQRQTCWHSEISGYIVKKSSPSCGMERVKIHYRDKIQANGTGIYTRILMQNFPDLPVEDENRLCDPALREDFIQRVSSYHRKRTNFESEHC